LVGKGDAAYEFRQACVDLAAVAESLADDLSPPDGNSSHGPRRALDTANCPPLWSTRERSRLRRAMQGCRVRIAGVIALAMGAAALAAPAVAGPPPTTNVSLGDDFFDPDDASQILGSSTHWDWLDTISDEHNVRQDDKLFRSGAPTSNIATTYTTVIAAGTFPYYCELHGNGIMDGVVRVKPLVGGYDGETLTVMWGDDGVERPSQYDVKYRVNDGKWKGWIKNTTAIRRKFGRNDNPVNVQKGKTYSFRGRTELRSNPKKASGFSPVESFSINR
jgi:plastocyanin